MLLISVQSRLISSVLCLLSGLLKEGHELISQALTLFSSVCGVLHEDVCMCLRLLGRLSYILGEFADVNMHYDSFLPMTFYLAWSQTESSPTSLVLLSDISHTPAL